MASCNSSLCLGSWRWHFRIELFRTLIHWKLWKTGIRIIMSQFPFFGDHLWPRNLCYAKSPDLGDSQTVHGHGSVSAACFGHLSPHGYSMAQQHSWRSFRRSWRGNIVESCSRLAKARNSHMYVLQLGESALRAYCWSELIGCPTFSAKTRSDYDRFDIIRPW